ncbi:MAG TPA: ABC transporter permease [Trebonia sp.]|nr:ABC transporter permease [Trebonia sp.]
MTAVLRRDVGRRVRTRRPTGSSAWLRRACLGALGLLLVFGAAELALWAGKVDQVLFPLPSTVVRVAFGMLGDPAFWSAVGTTLGLWAEAVAISVGIGVIAGLLLGTLPWAERALRPVTEFLRPLPPIVLYPLVLLIVQDGPKTEVAVIVFGAVWPVLINTVYGVGEVDPVARQTLRSFGFGPLAVAWRVSLPSAAPFVATGVRIAASLGFVVAIATELIGTGLNGIGSYLVQQEAGTVDISPILAVAVWSGVLGLVINGLFAAAERRAFRWHHLLTAASVAAGRART